MKISAFSKSYGSRTVLRFPDLELPDGRITAVIGPNGSGKSTLARVLAGIERSDQKCPFLTTLSVGYMPQKRERHQAQGKASPRPADRRAGPSVRQAALRRRDGQNGSRAPADARL